VFVAAKKWGRGELGKEMNSAVGDDAPTALFSYDPGFYLGSLVWCCESSCTTESAAAPDPGRREDK